jgi:thioredoxin 1
MLHVNDQATFQKEVLEEKNLPVLVDFFATWCPPCKMLAPILDELDQENHGVKIVKVDVDQAQALAQQYNVMSIPTLFIFKQGKMTWTQPGFQNKETLLNALK